MESREEQGLWQKKRNPCPAGCPHQAEPLQVPLSQAKLFFMGKEAEAPGRQSSWQTRQSSSSQGFGLAGARAGLGEVPSSLRCSAVKA